LEIELRVPVLRLTLDRTPQLVLRSVEPSRARLGLLLRLALLEERAAGPEMRHRALRRLPGAIDRFVIAAETIERRQLAREHMVVLGRDDLLDERKAVEPGFRLGIARERLLQPAVRDGAVPLRDRPRPLIVPEGPEP